MSFIATAIIGSAVVGGYVASESAKDQAAAAERGSRNAAAATTDATMAQLAEMRRQFNYQMQILMPQIEMQYRAQTGFADLLGLGGGSKAYTIPAPYSSNAGGPALQASQVNAAPIPATRNADGTITRNTPVGGNESPPSWVDTYNQQYGAYLDNQGINVPGAGSTQFSRGPNGEFIDPNLNPTRLADTATYGQTVRDNLLAPTSAEQDAYINYTKDNALAAPSLEQDVRFANATDNTLAGMRGDVSLYDTRGGTTLAGTVGSDTLSSLRSGDSIYDQRGDISLADQRAGVNNAGPSLTADEYYQNVLGRSLAGGAAGTSVYGDTFQTSPGYQFQVEEMQRALERQNSAGGNYGGRAILEAERRAQGLAANDYYNWAAGRTQDLTRLAGAEAADASRLDVAGANYLSRRGTDIARGDTMTQYDIGRGDTLYSQDQARADQFAQYDLARLDQNAMYDINRGDALYAQDVARGDQFASSDLARRDAAVSAYANLQAGDVNRGDVAYQNYLSRRAGDVSRLDSAAMQTDQLQAADQQRQDQAYYNYLNYLAGMAGFGNATGEAVNASGNYAAGVSNAYGNMGAQLSSNYNNLGLTQAQIESDRGANINGAFQSGVGNYLTYIGTKPQPTTTTSPKLGPATGGGGIPQLYNALGANASANGDWSYGFGSPYSGVY